MLQRAVAPKRPTPKRAPPSRTAVTLVGLLLSALVTAGLLALHLLAPAFVRLEHFAADARTAIFADQIQRQHPDIVIVTIDEDALAKFAGHNYRSPIDRAVQARLIGIIDRAQPRAIGLDFIYDRTTEPAKDDALAAALRDAHARVVLGAADERAVLTPAQQEWQKAFLARIGREAGHLSLTYDRDGIVRYLSRPAPGGPFRASFAELLARDSPVPPGAEKRAPIMPIAENDYRSHRIAWLKVEGQPPEETFRIVPAKALLEADQSGNTQLQTVLANLLRNRIVIVGGEFTDLDRHVTPLSAIGAPRLPGVQLHAHMVAQIIDRRAITHVSQLIEPAVVFGLTVLGFAIGRRWNVERFVYGIGVTLLIAGDAAVFVFLRTILPFTPALFGWLAGAWIGRNIGWLVPRRRVKEPQGELA